jgi:hypothetical protein
MTVNEFIKKLERISEDKKELPILIVCPNGLEVEPKLKMKFENYGSPLFGDKIEAMVISWE